jgi:ribulose-phosphate 3-epimerase
LSFLVEIIPAIIAKSYEEFEARIKKVEPYTSRVHLDIMDGKFVPNETIGGYEELDTFVKKFPKTKLRFEVHLMVNEPEKIIDAWLETPVDKYLIHWESTDEDLTGLIKSKGHTFGEVINPETTVDEIAGWIQKFDLIQIMTVHPGSYGAKFLPEMAEKIRAIHEKYPNLPIQVDGGVTPQTAPLVVGAGVTLLACGSFIQTSEDAGKAIEQLRKAVERA